MERPVHFYCPEVEGYVTLQVDIRINKLHGTKNVEIVIPEYSKVFREEDLLLASAANRPLHKKAGRQITFREVEAREGGTKMMIEERKDVKVIKGSREELEEYKAKHGVQRADGICVISADIPEDDFYKEKIKTLETENGILRAENARLARIETLAAARIKEKDDMIAKLKDALIEASIN